MYSPIADPSVVDNCTVMSLRGGLSRTNVSCASWLSSLAVYTNWLNLTPWIARCWEINKICLTHVHIHKQNLKARY